jgi:hypothetical protein
LDAGCVCAQAIAVAPNSAATTRTEIASLDHMAISSLGLVMRSENWPVRIRVPGECRVFGPERLSQRDRKISGTDAAQDDRSDLPRIKSEGLL